MSQAKELTAGSLGGIMQVLVGQPFDTIKVRLQTQPLLKPTYSGASDCFLQIVRNEGIKGLYKGTVTPLLGAGVCVGVQFGAVEWAKRVFSGPGDLSVSQLYISGAFAGLCNSIISGPMEHVRTRLQLQTTTKEFKGPLDLITKVVKNHGLPAIFKGQGVTMLREFHGFGIYFLVYEYLVQRTMKQNDITRRNVSSLSMLSYGALSGYILWIMIYPIDVIKTKLQTDAFKVEDRTYKGMRDCFQTVWKAEGYRGFYRGFSACMLRAGPANGVTFLTYEVVMNLLGGAK